MKTIKQTVLFKATPHEVYEAVMNSKKHAQFTGSPAKISNKIGGSFSTYDGGLQGKNLQLSPGKKIVQLWRCEMDGWPKEHYSTATFLLTKTKNGTKLAFTQTGVPDSCVKSISGGWKTYYWQPMKEILEK